MNCNYCNKECINSNSLRNHERTCKKNPKRQVPLGNRGGIPWNKGKTKENNEVIRNVSNELSRKYAEGSLIPSFLGKTHTLEYREMMSEKINKRYAEGWMPKSGRCKKLKYTSPTAGEITVDGSWELAAAKYFDSQNLIWNRNTKRFSYINKNGGISTYCPDFYIKTWDSFLEVKGYETDLDQLKWSQFPLKLIVWKKQQLKEHGIKFLSSGSAKLE
jgi:hypothetical protein